MALWSALVARGDERSSVWQVFPAIQGLYLWEQFTESNATRNARDRFNISQQLWMQQHLRPPRQISFIFGGAIFGQEWTTASTLPQRITDACFNSAVLSLNAESSIPMETKYRGSTPACILGTTDDSPFVSLRCGQSFEVANTQIRLQEWFERLRLAVRLR